MVLVAAAAAEQRDALFSVARGLLPMEQSHGSFRRLFYYEKNVTNTRDAERISTAFYRFLELHSHAAIDLATMEICPSPSGQWIRIRMWDEAALHAFEQHASTFQTPRPYGL